jgi:3-deoxy-D-manno-octulosonate 8-phosphate phosphatase (KDO 8-P phosphatase)
MRNRLRILHSRIPALRLLLLDVDGVLTDGRIYYGPRESEIKSFDVHDGLGIQRLQAAGINVGFLSNRRSPSVQRRARELGVKIVQTGVSDKLRVYETLRRNAKLEDFQVGYVGDDLPDLPLLQRVGLPFTVKGSPRELIRIALYATRRPGGRGAVREISDLILRQRAASQRKSKSK